MGYIECFVCQSEHSKYPYLPVQAASAVRSFAFLSKKLHKHRPTDDVILCITCRWRILKREFSPIMEEHIA